MFFFSIDSRVVAYSLLGAALLALFKRYFRRNKTLILPPGPPGLPFIGNAHLIPKEYAYLTFNAWRKQYGIFIYRAFYP